MTTENQSTDADGFLKTDAPIVDTASIEQSVPEAPAPKKRGRKSNAERAAMAAEQIEGGGAQKAAGPRKQASARKSYSDADVGAMSKQLLGLHQMAAMITGMPILMISEPEGQMLAQGIIAVSKEYDLSIDGKTGALIQILGAAAMIYVPRFGAIMSQSKAAKAAKKAASDANTIEVPSPH